MMTDATRTILLVEDDPSVAAMIMDILEDADFAVDGPHRTLSEGAAALAGRLPAGAVLDIRLGRQDVGLIADDLDAYGVPYLFCSGASGGSVPAAHPQAPVIPKDAVAARLVPALRRIVH
ncbi:response regulator transcription factor [Sphingobium sp. CCH11-B1]|jgi:CheY-like chemotaxis protein|uniref:response regulator transcription factor n=1 Tax=Sphingobium sp. CCH11-B1 TaxID=1768781 RepID=UPI00082ACDA2|nr:response regulator transcription factor [Sphingobium sp. CCH11-B1]MEA3388415.1 response regulator transcription factor [Pseudomonadota bacterium]